MQNRIPGKLRKSRLFSGGESAGKRSEGQARDSRDSGRAQLQVGVGIEVEEITEARLQELALDSNCRPVNPKRLQLEENGVEQLRGRRLRGENLSVTRNNPGFVENGAVKGTVGCVS